VDKNQWADYGSPRTLALIFQELQDIVHCGTKPGKRMQLALYVDPMVPDFFLDPFFPSFHGLESHGRVRPHHGGVIRIQNSVRRKPAVLKDEPSALFTIPGFDHDGTFMTHQEFFKIVIVLG
jgi:hypothetical protein